MWGKYPAPSIPGVPEWREWREWRISPEVPLVRNMGQTSCTNLPLTPLSVPQNAVSSSNGVGMSDSGACCAMRHCAVDHPLSLAIQYPSRSEHRLYLCRV